MRYLPLVMMVSCTLCIAQTPKQPRRASAPNRLSDSFSKASLRALEGLNRDHSERLGIVEAYIADASAEATTKQELQVVGDLRTLENLKVDTDIKLGDRKQVAQASAMAAGKTDMFDWVNLYTADPEVAKIKAHEKTCQVALETSLRARTYEEMPADCK